MKIKFGTGETDALFDALAEGGGGTTGAGAAGTTGAGAAGTVGAAGTTQPAATWYAGADAETVGYLQNRGWDKLTPAEAAIQASKAHRAAETLIGAPADQVLRLPKDANAPEWKGVWERLGAPADGKYDLSTVKNADGTAPSQAFLDSFSKAANELHLPKDAAVRLAASLTQFQDGVKVADLAAKTETLNTQKATLAREWGANLDANKFIAGQAAKALKVAPEAIQALENQIGYDAVMKMFHSIGTKIGEDKFIQSTAPGGGGAMTREQAVDTAASLKKDSAWVKRYLDGGVEEAKQMLNLNRIITGVFE